MPLSPRVVRVSVAACLLACLAFVYSNSHVADSSAQLGDDELTTSIRDTARAHELIRRQPGFFVPNLGQWNHHACFVHRAGAMSVFLEDRGWVLDLREQSQNRRPDQCDVADPFDRLRRHGHRSTRGVAVRMSFVGSLPTSNAIGERELPGHCNYFLGDDESRWRTDVPRYAYVRYENMYPGIDVRIHSADGHPEYDLLCDAGSKLSEVCVEVEGADRLAIDDDGCLRIDTALGPIRQPRPKTWECLDDGSRRPVECDYVLLGGDRFGFTARNRDDANALVIDPGLLWSTYLGGQTGFDVAYAVQVDAGGITALAGYSGDSKFPTTIGAYDRSHNGGSVTNHYDVFVCLMDTRKTGTAQLAYSTFLGGGGDEQGLALAVDSAGVITVVGNTGSSNFPTTANAFDTTYNGGSNDAFVSRLDPTLLGKAQLVYSTFLGGNGGFDNIWDFSISSASVVTAVGNTGSRDFPTTANAFDTSFNGLPWDGFVIRLDPSKVGSAQLVYSTFLGGKSFESVRSLAVDALGNVNVVGRTGSTDFPMTTGAFDGSFNGGTDDGFVTRLDLSKVGSAQLTYSTYLGGSTEDIATDLSVDIIGVVTVAGMTKSTNFPTTASAFDTTYNGGFRDAFVSRLDPTRLGKAQLVYSTFLGGSLQATGTLGGDGLTGLAVTDGVVTVSGSTNSSDFPTTRGAYDTNHGGEFDVFVSRLDPRRVGTAQLIYSTFLGGKASDLAEALTVDASGVATVAGLTIGLSSDYPTTLGAYSTKRVSLAAIVSRLDMGVPLYGDIHELSIKSGGTQVLTVNAGKTHANRSYWIFGSVTGTRPGLDLLRVHIPLNPDSYTNVAMAAVNTNAFTRFRGKLDANGLATASFNVPANLSVPSGFTFHHAYVVYDASGRFYMASNAVPVTLK
jgi:hypothetical protein